MDGDVFERLTASVFSADPAEAALGELSAQVARILEEATSAAAALRLSAEVDKERAQDLLRESEDARADAEAAQRNAREEADLLVQRAEEQADEIVRSAQQRANDLVAATRTRVAEFEYEAAEARRASLVALDALRVEMEAQLVAIEARHRDLRADALRVRGVLEQWGR